MRQVSANHRVASYEPETRSIRLGGHATSIRLERAFWAILEEIAARQGMALPKFLNALHDEVLELHGDCANFASLVRCTCLKYVSEIRTRDTPRAEPSVVRLSPSEPQNSSLRLPEEAV